MELFLSAETLRSIRKAFAALKEGDEDKAFGYWVEAWDSL